MTAVAGSTGTCPGGDPRPAGPGAGTSAQERPRQREFERPENEDDDGYDPYSDRLPDPEPLFERDPWA